MPELSHALFCENLNSEFHIVSESGNPTPLHLVHVSKIKDLGPYESYSVEFTGPSIPYLRQRTYELTHIGLGAHFVFLVPVGKTDNRYEYEAVFSRKKD